MGQEGVLITQSQTGGHTENMITFVFISEVLLTTTKEKLKTNLFLKKKRAFFFTLRGENLEKLLKRLGGTSV